MSVRTMHIWTRSYTHLVGECVYWHTECSGETKITELELPFPVDQQVLWLEVTVKNPVLVAEGSAF